MNKRRLFTGPIIKSSDTAFVSPMGDVRYKIPAKASSVFSNLATGAMITYDAYQALPPSVKRQFVNFGSSVRSGIIKGGNNNKTNNRGNRMNGRNNKQVSDSRVKDAGLQVDTGTFYLSRAVKPSSISLNTGIKPNTYVSDYMDAVQSSCSPLHLSSAIIKIPTTTTFDLYKYFNQIIAYDLQSKAQANVGFSLDITSNFSSSQLLTAINALMYALQVYFYYASIITYHDNPANKNMGMIAIRNAMTVDNFNDLARLGRRLADTPCPPNMMSLMKYMSGNFLTGPNPSSTMIKIVPGQCVSTGLLSINDLTNAMTALNTDATNEVFALLRRAVPQWVPGSLSDIPSTPLYDENFKTIFANLPFRLYNTSLSKSYGFPYVTNGDDIQYNSFSNNLDGAAFALCGYYSVNDDDVYPGLVYPYNDDVSGYGSTRRSYYVESGVTKFVTAESSDYISRSRPETYQAAGDSTVTLRDPIHLAGASKCLGVSTKTIRETTYKVIDWMMSLDTIKNGMIKKQILS